MDFRDRVADAKDTAATTAAGARETVAEKTDGARETAAEATGTASTVVSTAKGAVSAGAADAGGRVAAGLPDRVVDSSVVNGGIDGGTPVHRLASVSYERFALPDVRVRSAVERGGGRAADVARAVDLRRMFRFGKNGFAYGKTFGDYVPVVGSYLPYVGFATGIGVGVLDGIDVLSADAMADLSASVSAALEQAVGDDGGTPAERSAADGVAADPAFEERGANGPRDLLGMDFEEFAGKR